MNFHSEPCHSDAVFHVIVIGPRLAEEKEWKTLGEAYSAGCALGEGITLGYVGTRMSGSFRYDTRNMKVGKWSAAPEISFAGDVVMEGKWTKARQEV
jgi:hypothetical protein